MSQALTAQPTQNVKHLLAGVLVGWFLLALSGSLLGVFDSAPRPPIALGLANATPLALFFGCYVASAAFRQFVLSLDLRLLTAVQTWRVAGIVFLILYHRGALPGAFAIPAGWGDIAVGITAPLLARYWHAPFPYKAFVVWNVFGILDLVLAVSLGIVSSATPLGVLAGDATTQPMSQFPLSLIPTFFVPLMLIFHLISLIRVRKEIP